MKVEITEERLSDVDPDTGKLYLQTKGDRITVPDALGKKWCKYGWAKDTSGKVKSAERKPGVQALEVQSVKSGSKGRIDG